MIFCLSIDALKQSNLYDVLSTKRPSQIQLSFKCFVYFRILQALSPLELDLIETQLCEESKVFDWLSARFWCCKFYEYFWRCPFLLLPWRFIGQHSNNGSIYWFWEHLKSVPLAQRWCCNWVKEPNGFSYPFKYFLPSDQMIFAASWNIVCCPFK